MDFNALISCGLFPYILARDFAINARGALTDKGYQKGRRVELLKYFAKYFFPTRKKIAQQMLSLSLLLLY